MFAPHAPIARPAAAPAGAAPQGIAQMLSMLAASHGMPAAGGPGAMASGAPLPLGPKGAPASPHGHMPVMAGMPPR